MGAPTPLLPPSQAEGPGSPRTPKFLSCCSPIPTLQELPKPHVLSSSGTNHLSCLESWVVVEIQRISHCLRLRSKARIV